MTTPIGVLYPDYLSTRVYNNLCSASKWEPAYTTVEQVEAASDDTLRDRRNMGQKGIDEVRDGITAFRAGKPLPTPPHRPTRGSDVEAWIKTSRDAWRPADGSLPLWPDRARVAYDALDDLLDDYRLHADTGTTLDVSAEQLGPHTAGVTDA